MGPWPPRNLIWTLLVRLFLLHLNLSAGEVVFPSSFSSHLLFLPQTRWTWKPITGYLGLFFILIEWTCTQSGHLGNMSLPLGLAPANLKEMFLTLEELDVAFNLGNESWTWKPFWVLTAGQLHNECINEDCSWIAWLHIDIFSVSCEWCM